MSNFKQDKKKFSIRKKIRSFCEKIIRIFSFDNDLKSGLPPELEIEMMKTSVIDKNGQEICFHPLTGERFYVITRVEIDTPLGFDPTFLVNQAGFDRMEAYSKFVMNRICFAGLITLIVCAGRRALRRPDNKLFLDLYLKNPNSKVKFLSDLKPSVIYSDDPAFLTIKDISKFFRRIKTDIMSTFQKTAIPSSELKMQPQKGQLKKLLKEYLPIWKTSKYKKNFIPILIDENLKRDNFQKLILPPDLSKSIITEPIARNAIKSLFPTLFQNRSFFKGIFILYGSELLRKIIAFLKRKLKNLIKRNNEINLEELENLITQEFIDFNFLIELLIFTKYLLNSMQEYDPTILTIIEKIRFLRGGQTKDFFDLMNELIEKEKSDHDISQSDVGSVPINTLLQLTIAIYITFGAEWFDKQKNEDFSDSFWNKLFELKKDRRLKLKRNLVISRFKKVLKFVRNNWPIFSFILILVLYNKTIFNILKKTLTRDNVTFVNKKFCRLLLELRKFFSDNLENENNEIIVKQFETNAKFVAEKIQNFYEARKIKPTAESQRILKRLEGLNSEQIADILKNRDILELLKKEIRRVFVEYEMLFNEQNDFFD